MKICSQFAICLTIVIDGKSCLRITSSTGPCVVVRSSDNITIKASEIGSCRGNAITISNSSQINVYDNYIHPEAPL